MRADEFRLVVEYASRAPSGHNTQPWLFQFDGQSITLYPDFSRKLPVVDPTRRELYISLGCAAENARIAALSLGYTPSITITRKGSISFSLQEKKAPQEQPLLRYIYARQTNRKRYKGVISDDTINQIAAIPLEHSTHLYCYKRGTGEFSTIAELVAQGNTLQLENPLFVKELRAWIRINKAEVQRRMDGLSYAAFGAPSLPAWISRPIFLQAISAKKQRRRDERLIASSSHLMLLSTTSNHPEGWVLLGMSLQRLLLQATSMGLAHAYLNQPNEVPELASTLAQKLQLQDQTPCILLRLGYAKTTPPSPRRNLSSIIINNAPLCES